MSKRFTDTDKWKYPFLRALKAPYKLLWLYIQDDCNHAGIWEVDIEVAQVKTGEKKLTIEESLQAFSGSISVFDNGQKWFIPDFIEFQYGELNPENRAHNSVIKLLLKYELITDKGLIKPLISPLQVAKYKDKELVKDMDKSLTIKPKIESKEVLFRNSFYFEIENIRIELFATEYEKANLNFYYEAMLNWSDANGKKKKDWLATTKSFMQRDIKEGKLVTNFTQNETIKGLSQTLQNFDSI